MGKRKAKAPARLRATPAQATSAPTPVAPLGPPTPAVRRWLGGIIAVFLLLSVGYALRVPVNDAPDEFAHVQYIRYLADAHRFPQLSAGTEAGYEAHQPPVFYILAAVVHTVTGGSVHAVRLMNTLLGVLTIIVTFCFVRELLPRWGDALALSTAAFVGLLPMNLYILSVVSNDPLVNLLAACVLLRLVRSSRDGFGFAASAWTGALIGLAVITKSTAVPLVAVGPLACVLAAHSRGESARRTVGTVGTMVLAIGAVSLPWLVRNIMLYGDPFAMKAFNEVFTKGLTDRPRPEWFLPMGAADMAYWTKLVAPWTWRTFIGGFGHLTPDRFMPKEVYQAYVVPTILSAIGLVIFADVERDGARGLEEWRRRLLGVLVVGMFLVFLGYIEFNVTYFQAQARYLFLMLPAIAVLYLVGLGRVVPLRARTAVLGGFVGSLAALSAAALVLWVMPPGLR